MSSHTAGLRLDRFGQLVSFETTNSRTAPEPSISPLGAGQVSFETPQSIRSSHGAIKTRSRRARLRFRKPFRCPDPAGQDGGRLDHRPDRAQRGGSAPPSANAAFANQKRTSPARMRSRISWVERKLRPPRVIADEHAIGRGLEPSRGSGPRESLLLARPRLDTAAGLAASEGLAAPAILRDKKA
jgi:hypothetical protein